MKKFCWIVQKVQQNIGLTDMTECASLKQFIRNLGVFTQFRLFLSQPQDPKMYSLKKFELRLYIHKSVKYIITRSCSGKFLKKSLTLEMRLKMTSFDVITKSYWSLVYQLAYAHDNDWQINRSFLATVEPGCSKKLFTEIQNL